MTNAERISQSEYRFQGIDSDGMAVYEAPAAPAMVSTDGGQNWEVIGR
jgi:hypothetical protein